MDIAAGKVAPTQPSIIPFSTFRDWGAELGDYPNEPLELAIARAVGDRVEAAYRRGDMLVKRHQLVADWERYCNAT